jgi:hypothetical protein
MIERSVAQRLPPAQRLVQVKRGGCARRVGDLVLRLTRVRRREAPDARLIAGHIDPDSVVAGRQLPAAPDEASDRRQRLVGVGRLAHAQDILIRNGRVGVAQVGVNRAFRLGRRLPRARRERGGQCGMVVVDNHGQPHRVHIGQRPRQQEVHQAVSRVRSRACALVAAAMRTPAILRDA